VLEVLTRPVLEAHPSARIPSVLAPNTNRPVGAARGTYEVRELKDSLVK